MPVPLYGFLEGDTIGLLIIADENETLKDLAVKLQKAASIRVKPAETVQLVFKGQAMNLSQTVAQSGLTALDQFDICQEHKEKERSISP